MQTQDNSRNRILSIQGPNGEWINGTQNILDAARDHFLNIYDQPEGVDKDDIKKRIRDSGIPHLSEHHITSLNRVVHPNGNRECSV